MSIDFSKVKALTIPEGNVTQITDASGRVLWKAAPAEATVTIQLSGAFITPQIHLWLEINGTTYQEIYTPTEITVPIGTVIKCCFQSAYTVNKIYLNDTVIAEGVASYDYTVMGDVSIIGSLKGTAPNGVPNITERYFKITEH